MQGSSTRDQSNALSRSSVATAVDEKEAAYETTPEARHSRDGEIKDEESQDLSSVALEQPPDGGLTAWLQVLASLLFFFNTWGMINTFGVFQTYYQTTLPQNPSDIAWIGTFQAFLVLLVGGVTGPLYDKGYLRYLLAAGLFLVSFGLMMLSLSTEYYQIFLSQGLVVGLGSGCLQIPSLALPSQYFLRRRARAIGIAAIGGSLAAVIYPIVFRRLQIEVSFGWATRTMGFIALGTIGLGSLVSRPRIPPSGKARALIDTMAFKDAKFILLSLALIFFFMGIYMPFFYISTWAQTYLDLDADLSFYMFTIMNAGSIFGRVIPGFLGDRFGSLNVLIITNLISAIMIFAWISVKSTATLVIFSAFYGFFSGASVSLPGSVAAGIVPEMSKVGTWMGMCFGLAGVGVLIGNPIAGAILGKSFVGAQCFAGAVVLVGCICLCALRYVEFKMSNA